MLLLNLVSEGPSRVSYNFIHVLFQLIFFYLDAFALRSHTLASKSQKAGLFNDEIIPVTLANGTVVSLSTFC